MKDPVLTEVQRTVLYGNDSFEIVSILWSQETKSPNHNHGWSHCQVLIQEGVFENTLYAGPKKEVRVLEVGQVLSTPVGATHEMRCLSKTGKTLHVYTPKIKTHKDVDRKFDSAIGAELMSSLKLGESVRFEQLNEILQQVQENSISTNSPYFMNQLFSGVYPQALLAQEVISRTKTTLATQEASSVFSKIETEIVDQLCSMIGWEAKYRDGVSVPGGSAANFMALQLAKQKYFPETKRQGISGKKFRIYVSSDAHYSFEKAAVAMGFGTDAVVKIGVCEKRKMMPDLLDQAIRQSIKEGHQPLLVCATAGTTVYGAFDSIKEMSQICREHDIWLHVDGAWGGPALFSEKSRNLVDQIELADSVTFDAHKLFGASLTCSFLLTQHKGLLLEANDVSGADYLFHDNSVDPDRGKMSWQCGRGANALSFWAIWKNLGTTGFEQLIDQLFTVRDESIDWIRTQDRLELIGEPLFLNLCVRLKDREGRIDENLAKKAREALKKQNLAMVNYSIDEQGSFLRLILAHPHLTSSHVKDVLNYALGAI